MFAMVVLEGVRGFTALVLALDSVHCLRDPEASLLSLVLRWPGGDPLPPLVGLLIALAMFYAPRLLALAAAMAGANAAEFFVLPARDQVGSRIPIPLSLFACIIFTACAWRPPEYRRPLRIALAATLTGCGLLLAIILLYGATDYRRPAQAILVFGAKVFPDGHLSAPLEDRVQEGIRLYKQGYAPILIFSGAPNEPPAMKRVALQAGVPESAIELDTTGVNTEQSLRNLRYSRVLAVSHFYHLARIKHAGTRLGKTCLTVPCAMNCPHSAVPFDVARECAAYLSYYLRPY
jgi:uncharacterized SAM-binding protein YcdF (DUF218 family)